MWYKVSWLTFWVSMTLWVGNFWGCAAPGEDQNYRAHADGGGLYERENHDRPRDPNEKGIFAGIRDSIEAAPARDQSTSNSSVTNRGPEGGEGDAGADGENTEAANAGESYVAMPEETEPSITSLDRSHWKKIKVQPDAGVTEHNPIYHKDCPSDRAHQKVDFSKSVEDQLIASLDGAYAMQWDEHHTIQMFAQVGKHCFDTVALPVRVVMQHPWTVVTTP